MARRRRSKKLSLKSPLVIGALAVGGFLAYKHMTAVPVAPPKPVAPATPALVTAAIQAVSAAFGGNIPS